MSAIELKQVVCYGDGVVCGEKILGVNLQKSSLKDRPETTLTWWLQFPKQASARGLAAEMFEPGDRVVIVDGSSVQTTIGSSGARTWSAARDPYVGKMFTLNSIDIDGDCRLSNCGITCWAPAFLRKATAAEIFEIRIGDNVLIERGFLPTFCREFPEKTQQYVGQIGTVAGISFTADGKMYRIRVSEGDIFMFPAACVTKVCEKDIKAFEKLDEALSQLPSNINVEHIAKRVKTALSSRN